MEALLSKLNVHWFYGFAFSLFNPWHLALGFLILAICYIYKARAEIITMRGRRGLLIRALNWGILGVSYLAIYAFPSYFTLFREIVLIRMMIGLFLLSEIAYNFPILYAMFTEASGAFNLKRNRN